MSSRGSTDRAAGDRVIVVGAGLAGTAAAVRLAAAGVPVTLVDANHHVGGKMNVWEQSGYRFDMGPTIITMPGVLERLFESAGRRMSHYLDLRRLDPQWRCSYADGAVLDLWQDPQKMRAEIERLSPSDARQYEAFLRYSREMFDISDEFFFWRSWGGISDVFKEYRVGSLDGLRMGSRIHPFTSFHSAVRRHFTDPRLVQLFDHFTQYVGSSPFMAPAILTLIAWAQIELGVWYPMGGTGAIARALHRLAVELGVDLRLGQGVERIGIEGGRVSGVVLEGGETLPARAVVSNRDVIRTYRDLIQHPRAAQFLRKERKRLEPACSGVVLYLGCNRTWESLRHHVFMFSRDPDDEFHRIYERGEPAPDMTVYLAAPSLTDPSMAPEGHTSLYALVHTPYRRDTANWDEIAPRYREAILDRMEERGLEGLRESIQVSRMLTPRDIEQLYASERGSIYGLLTRRGLTAAFKPGNRCREFPGLYFAGGSVNPGAGVPMVLMSGQVAADCILEDLGAARSSVISSAA